MSFESDKQRFESRVAKTDAGCHTWTGKLDKDGYGLFFLLRANRRAHRAALYFAGRKIPDDHVVNHVCRNRACVNPQHLNTVTAAENSKRDSTSITYINSQKTHCKKGHEFDRTYAKQRYCSICESEKRSRLRAKWKAQGIVKI